jgi:triacylglycerol esterase/lipase EstA (alpha/beta hydrolase family)
VILVGHSMGGLVARAYLQRHGESRVAGLVTLGTPHQGSRLAHIGYGENARQMRPGSPWLQALASPAPVVDTVVIYSPHDNFVMPQSQTATAGSTQSGDRRNRSPGDALFTARGAGPAGGTRANRRAPSRGRQRLSRQ